MPSALQDSREMTRSALGADSLQAVPNIDTTSKYLSGACLYKVTIRGSMGPAVEKGI